MTKTAETPDQGARLDQHVPEEETARLYYRRPHRQSPKEIFLVQLGKNIGCRLRGREITVPELAKRTGLSIDTVQRLLAGKVEPSFYTLYQVSKVIGPICIQGKRHFD